MFRNYVKIAIRSIGKNKLYALINILGLTMGLAIYIFGGLLADYENSHDAFYKNADRTYTIRSVFNPAANVGVIQNDGVQSALGPIIKAELSEIDAVARTKSREFLLSVGENSFYQSLRFADPELLQIFDFDYISGDASALNSTTGTMITESIARKYFPDQDPMGQTITLDHQHDLFVRAVIHDLPANTHFNSAFIQSIPMEIIVPMNAMERITDFKPDENWGQLSMGDLTYIMLPENLDGEWLQTQMDGIYDRHYDIERKEFIIGVVVRPLVDANTAFWDALGIPAIDVVEMLGLLVLIVACVNYTNLATAQSMGRAREVGLRKTLGAGRPQLLIQFIVESMTITIIALIIALTILELIIPSFNSATGKILSINYINTIPWLLLTTVIVGIFSGAYPAYLITKTSPIEALRDAARKGRSASWVRSIMIGVQFSISVFMLALVLVVYAQNSKVEESSNIFAKDQIYTLDRINVEQIEQRHEILRNEMLTIPGVENFTLSSQVPYEQTTTTFTASTILNDISSGFDIFQLNVDHEFIDTYDIPIIAGRNISRDVALDTHVRERGKVNAMVNKLAVQRLGFASPQEAIGQVFYEDEGERGITTYTIIGVTGDVNIRGFHNVTKPSIFFMRDASYRLASIKLSDNATPQTINEIEAAWKRVNPDYPMQGKFLDETFQSVYIVFKLGTQSLAAFAIFALFLALIGLFGLAAFMAEQRTKEMAFVKFLAQIQFRSLNFLSGNFQNPYFGPRPLL
ncbi:MAG: ABC transporter permease [Emcibacteraceae bacterium]|nr:ABC transporter permease [Emcibacteraceae bacterium]